MESGETDEEGRSYRVTEPPPTALCLVRGTDPRSLEDRVCKLLILLFDALRDGNKDLTADGSLEPASKKFLHKMEEGFKLASGETKPPKAWREIHENGK